jgi:Tol biopolymer transport system component
MTTEARFERELPAILEDLYVGSSPDYRDEALAVAGRRRQRPSWSFAGRWFPMFDVAVRPVPAPRLPLRGLVTALLILALVAAALAYVGSRPRVPPPFGPARNGLITWAIDGDIFVGDPESGSSRRVVASSDIDRNPVFSRDGSHLAFMRQVPVETGRFDLIVTDADGGSSRTLTSVPVSTPDAIEWAPDSASLLVNERDGRLTRLFVDGSQPQLLLEGGHTGPGAFRPPDGGQILYERVDDPGALFVMNADGSGARQLFGPLTAPCSCSVGGRARWSPDGRMVAFTVNTGGDQARLFVVDAEGGGLRQLTDEDGVWVENDPAWSPDGSQIAFNRWQRDDAGTWHVRSIAVVDVASGALTPLGIAPASEGALIEWAPDGLSILSLPGTLVGAFRWSPNANGTVARPVLIELADGTSRQLDWSVGSIATWQRLAP